MEELLKVQFVIIIRWKMKTEEQKSSFIINYKSNGNQKRGEVTMLYRPLSVKLQFQMLMNFVPKKKKKNWANKILVIELTMSGLRSD